METCSRKWIRRTEGGYLMLVGLGNRVTNAGVRYKRNGQKTEEVGDRERGNGRGEYPCEWRKE